VVDLSEEAACFMSDEAIFTYTIHRHDNHLERSKTSMGLGQVCCVQSESAIVILDTVCGVNMSDTIHPVAVKAGRHLVRYLMTHEDHIPPISSVYSLYELHSF
jgi:hypothetical protein